MKQRFRFMRFGFSRRFLRFGSRFLAVPKLNFIDRRRPMVKGLKGGIRAGTVGGMFEIKIILKMGAPKNKNQ